MDTGLTTLVENLARVKGLSEGFEQLAEAKLRALNEINESLTADVKEKLRVGMDFKLVKKGKLFDSKKRSFDERGQEYAVDVVGSIKKGYRLREDKKKTIMVDGKEQERSEWGALNDAYGIIVDLTKKALDQKLPDGTPVYDPRPIVRNGEQIETLDEARRRVNDEIERDIFTPLVREGLLPETFVLDEYSEVAKLIKNSLKAYKETTQRKKDETEEKFAKNNFNAAGGGKKATDRLSGFGGTLGRKVDQRLGDNASDIKRRGKVGIDIIKFGKEGGQAFSSLKGIISGKAFGRAQDFLDPTRPEALKKLSPERMKELGLDSPNALVNNVDEDKIRLQLENQYKQDRLFPKESGNLSGAQSTPMTEADEQRKKNLLNLYETLNSDPVFYTQKSIDLLSDYGGGTVAIIGDITETTKVYGEKVFAKRGGIVVAAGRTAELIDQLLQGVMREGNDLLGTAFEGAYSESFNVAEVMKTLIDEAGDDTTGKVDFAQIAKAYAEPFKKAFAKVSPKPKTEVDDGGEENKPKVDLPALLKSAGELLAMEYAKIAEQEMEGRNKDFQKDLADQPELAFAPLLFAATQCLGKPFDDFKNQITEAAKGGDVARDMMSASLDLGDEAKLDELMRTEDEAKEFQKQLVLIDKGGMSIKSLEAMIQELKESKAVLDLVGTIGKTLFSAPGAPIQIAGRAAKKLTAEVTGEVVMALKAAKLIMELVVNIKKAVDRWSLFSKFKQDVQRSRVAVSSLTSTLQGFFNNKKEQVTLNTINDVLMIVQIAGNIVGSVPTPYTLVIGKTMDKVAGALRQGNKVAGELYNERMLSKGWDATKKALRDPTNRTQGLKALRLNPTLGMHSIAWAAMEKTPPDPIARMFLADLGITEQMLAASGTEQKILEYLQTLLDEDRSLIDFHKIKTKWAPDNPELDLKDWFITVSRARKDAEPPLAGGGDEAVMAAFKAINKRVETLDQLEQRAQTGSIGLLESDLLVDEAEDLCSALDDYEPLTPEGTSHDEMLLVAGGFLKKAGERRNRVMAIANTNMEKASESKESFVKALQEANQELEKIVSCKPEDVTKHFTLKHMVRLRETASKTLFQITFMWNPEKRENLDVAEPLKRCEENVAKLNDIIITYEPRSALPDLEELQDRLDGCEHDLELLDLQNQSKVESVSQTTRACCQTAKKLVEAVTKTGVRDEELTRLTSELKSSTEKMEVKLKNLQQLAKQESN